MLERKSQCTTLIITTNYLPFYALFVWKLCMRTDYNRFALCHAMGAYAFYFWLWLCLCSAYEPKPNRTQENVLVLLVRSVLCSFVKRSLICSIERIKLRCETKITVLANEYKKKTTTSNTNIGNECFKRYTCGPYKLLRLFCSAKEKKENANISPFNPVTVFLDIFAKIHLKLRISIWISKNSVWYPGW